MSFGNAVMVLARVRDFFILMKLAVTKIGYIMHDQSAATFL